LIFVNWRLKRNEKLIAAGRAARAAFQPLWFDRQETLGMERLITAIGVSRTYGEVRFTRGAGVFDDLYEYFRRRRG